MPPSGAVNALSESLPIAPSATYTGEKTAVFSRRPVMALRDEAPKWLKDVLRQIESLRHLQPNWDSYGAAAIDHLSVFIAQATIRYLSRFQNVDAPVVGATPDGDVGFSWDAGNWSLDAEVSPTGHVGYVYLDEHDHAKDRDTSTYDLDELAELLTGW